MATAVSQLQKIIFLTVVLLCSVFAKAQNDKVYSDLELDSLLQSQKWLCGLPVGFATIFDSLQKERVLVTEGTERSEYYFLIFSKKEFKCEQYFTLNCSSDGYIALTGFYDLNADGTITIQIKRSECSGEGCYGEPGQKSYEPTAVTYDVRVHNESIIFKLREER